jgi:hypothetical protein
MTANELAGWLDQRFEELFEIGEISLVDMDRKDQAAELIRSQAAKIIKLDEMEAFSVKHTNEIAVLIQELGEGNKTRDDWIALMQNERKQIKTLLSARDKTIAKYDAIREAK